MPIDLTVHLNLLRRPTSHRYALEKTTQELSTMCVQTRMRMPHENASTLNGCVCPGTAMLPEGGSNLHPNVASEPSFDRIHSMTIKFKPFI